MKTIGRGLATIAAISALLGLATPHDARAAKPPAATLRVFAAASLADAFHEIAGAFEKTHPGFKVQMNLAGSQQLAAQLAQGAPADVFASADERWMDDARAHGVLDGDARVFAHNRLVVVVPRTNPGRIGRLQDLSRRGVKLVIGAEAVPVGKYSREMLQNLSRSPGFDSDFARRTLANVVSEEENVKSVVGKVQLGEADAGIVYRSDVSAAVARYVNTIAIPDSANVTAVYPIAVVKGAPQAAAARDFVELVLSADGQRTLARRGLIPATP